jgi:hypothetical protein
LVALRAELKGSMKEILLVVEKGVKLEDKSVV